jgi:ubiquinone/menaquinone biosynthesis C-methylase UbiE
MCSGMYRRFYEMTTLSPSAQHLSEGPASGTPLRYAYSGSMGLGSTIIGVCFTFTGLRSVDVIGRVGGKMSRYKALRGLVLPSVDGFEMFRMGPADKDEVREFWTNNPNLINEASSERGTLDFFRQVDESRKQTHWPLYEIVPFSTTEGLDVLEIGCGLGTDAVEFAKSGARYTGIDLTEPAVNLTREKLKAYGLPGCTRQADAEELPFPDESFDVVYSWGVIHHTPDTERCVAEIRRVLRPGGKLMLMLYHAHGWWEYRIRHHWRLLSLLRFRIVASLVIKLGADKKQVETFRALYRQDPDTLRERFIAKETDGAFESANPHSKLYSRSGMRALLRNFEEVDLKAAHWMELPLLRRFFGSTIYFNLQRYAGAVNGSCLYAFARKPLGNSRVKPEATIAIESVPGVLSRKANGAIQRASSGAMDHH